jgi:hypothetical protein
LVVLGTGSWVLTSILLPDKAEQVSDISKMSLFQNRKMSPTLQVIFVNSNVSLLKQEYQKKKKKGGGTI